MRIVIAIIFLFPAIAAAEVMDKTASVQLIWIWGIGSTAASFASARYRPWTLAIVVPIIAVFFGLLIDDWFSEDLGPALHEEAGTLWIGSVFIFPIVSLVSLYAGWRIRRHAA